MNRTLAAFVWSLSVAAHSYRLVVALAALAALWAYSAYAWLSVPESSVLMLIVAFIWAIVQASVAIVIAGGIVAGATHTASTEGKSLPLKSLWTISWKSFLNTLMFAIASLVLVWLIRIVFGWINGHSLEVASFLTFHSQKAVSHVPIDQIYQVIEGLLWIVVSGYLLSFFIVLLRQGWVEASRQRPKLLAECAFRGPFVASLLSVAVFGGLAYKLATWHPVVPPGFWDYAQLIVRFSLALFLLFAGLLFWTLSLARLQAPKQNSAQVE